MKPNSVNRLQLRWRMFKHWQSLVGCGNDGWVVTSRWRPSRSRLCRRPVRKGAAFPFRPVYGHPKKQRPTG